MADGRESGGVIHGDCLVVMAGMAEASVDAVVTDPPYHLASVVKRFANANASRSAYMSCGFMGQRWDGGDIAFQPETWAAMLRVLKPGGHLCAFAAPRNQHRMVCAIEDAGFEIRDCLMWVYGSGFPKSLDISKALDRAAGVEREIIGVKVNTYDGANRDPTKHGNPADQSNIGKWGLTQTPHGMPLTAPATEAARQWAGWGTALKPAYEPICLARKPLDGTVAANVLAHGVGGLNIDGCRVEAAGVDLGRNNNARMDGTSYVVQRRFARIDNSRGLGRWPANLVHDGSDEVVGLFPETGMSAGGGMKDLRKGKLFLGETNPNVTDYCGFGDSGSAARFFYTAKADGDHRLGSKHPTVKPLDLMRWLVRLVCPKGGVVLDPFAGTGTTGEAALLEGMRAVLIEREAAYYEDIRRRMAHALASQRERDIARVRARNEMPSPGPLFDGQ